MLYKVRVEVSLKPGHSDPEGEMTARSLRELSYNVHRVETSKVYRMIIEAKDKKEVEAKVEEMCKRLLANPTKDNYNTQVEEVK